MTQKVPKKQHAEKVEAVHAEAEPVLDTPAETAPLTEEEPPLTDAERAEAAELVPQPESPKVELRAATRYCVTAGGRAWWQGQCIQFRTGEEFTSETWDELNVARFRECGVTIEQIQ